MKVHEENDVHCLLADAKIGIYGWSAKNIIHGSDGSETAKEEISLWFEPSELVSYTSNGEKWVYGAN